MIVRESISFERGQDPKDAMRIGRKTWDKLKKRDILRLKKEIHINGRGEFISAGGRKVWQEGFLFITKVNKEIKKGKEYFDIKYYQCWDLEEAIIKSELSEKTLLGYDILSHPIIATKIQLENRFEIVQPWEIDKIKEGIK